MLTIWSFSRNPRQICRQLWMQSVIGVSSGASPLALDQRSQRSSFSVLPVTFSLAKCTSKATFCLSSLPIATSEWSSLPHFPSAIMSIIWWTAANSRANAPVVSPDVIALFASGVVTCLAWPSGTPNASVLCELGLHDGLRVSSGRALALYARLASFALGSRPLVPASVFTLAQSTPGSWAHWCRAVISHHSVQRPDLCGVGPGCSASVTHGSILATACGALSRPPPHHSM